MVFFIISLICSLLFIAAFIAIQFIDNRSTANTAGDSTVSAADIANNTDCVKKSHEYLKSWFIIIGSAILLINCINLCNFSFLLSIYVLC